MDSGWTLREVAPEEPAQVSLGGVVAGPQRGREDRRCSRGAERPAIHDPFTNASVEGHVRRRPDLAAGCAAGLAARGVGAGDVVTFQTPNWIEGVVTFYGAALLGAVAAPIVHIYGSRETAYILKQCQPKVHVTASRFGYQDFLANLESMADLPDFELVVTDEKVPSGQLPLLRAPQ